MGLSRCSVSQRETADVQRCWSRPRIIANVNDRLAILLLGVMKRLLFAAVIALISSEPFAQTGAVDASLATPTGHEVNVTLGSYTYIEPGPLRISIHATKVGGEYTGALLLNKRQRWFAQADVRGTIGNASYAGWCLPWLITPNSASPNGYALDLGDASPCGETGDTDW